MCRYLTTVEKEKLFNFFCCSCAQRSLAKSHFILCQGYKHHLTFFFYRSASHEYIKDLFVL